VVPSQAAQTCEYVIVETSRKVLLIVVGLLVVLSISWAVYPRVYGHYNPTPSWPGLPDNWGPSNAQLSFLVATLLAVLGFFQLGFERWFRRGTSRFLFWVFLLLGLVLALDYWTFALAIRFWTFTMNMLSGQARQAYEISRMLAPYFLKAVIAVGVLNIGLAFFRKRSF
jgi:hypothetical protein